MDKAETVFEKIARKLNVSSFEDQYLSGVLLPDKAETKAKKMYATKVNESFTLRHPWLTGIPTLGIAPAYADDKAKSEIARSLLQRDKKLSKSRDKRRKELETIAVKMYKARMMAPQSTNITTVVNEKAATSAT